MSKEFELEDRYIVFKVKDLKRYVSNDTAEQIVGDALYIDIKRRQDGRGMLQGIFIERDWPEFEVVYAMLAKRMNAAPEGGAQ